MVWIYLPLDWALQELMMQKHKAHSVLFEKLLCLVPAAPNWFIDWTTIWQIWPDFAKLDDCPQDAIFHAEGDAGIHTRMVVASLVEDQSWRNLSKERREILFWSACLHDIGKPATTVYEEDGRITSKGHSRIGASIARELLWYAGAPFHWREEVCAIINKHQLPFWLIERPNSRRLAIETSWQCSANELCLHAKNDALGRICKDQEQILENIELTRIVFADAKCEKEAFLFANDESRVTFFEKLDRDPYYAAHEEFRCEVFVMSAPPGTGKDTWISQNKPDLPVVSLDAIRQELRISPTANQGKVIQAAYEQAKQHLRQNKNFIWNATNTTQQTRGKVLSLLRDYNARIHIVYLEADPIILSKQNYERESAVPNSVMQKLIKKLEPPTLLEAHQVSFFT